MGFEIDRCGCLKLVSNKRELVVVSAAGAWDQCIGEGIGGVWVEGCERTDRGSDRNIFSDGCSAQDNRGRRFIDIGDVDHKCFFRKEPTCIGRTYPDAMDALLFEIEVRVGKQGVTDNLPIGIVSTSRSRNQTVRVGVYIVSIGGAERANQGWDTCGLVFRDGRIGKRDVRRRIVHIEDLDRQRCFDSKATGVDRSNADRVGRTHIEIEDRGTPEFIPDDGKEAVVLGSRSADQRISKRVARIWIARAQIADQGIDRQTLIDGARVDCHERWSFVDIGDKNLENPFESGTELILDSGSYTKGFLGLKIK